MHSTAAAVGGGRVRLPPGERRALIVGAAAREFGANGYDGTTIERIAAGAGVTKPMVYRHFDSKRALYLELLRRHREDLPSFLEGVVLDGEGGLKAGLRIVLVRWFDYVALNSHGWTMLFRDRGGDDEIQAFRGQVSARALEVMSRFVAASPSRLPADQITPTAECLRSGLAGLALHSIDNPAISRDDLVEVALRMSMPAFEPVDVE